MTENKCKFIHQYKCNKKCGLGCLGCKTYKIYTKGYQDCKNETTKALDIIIKYTYSGGWSGDYTTEYYKMKKKEIDIIDKLFLKKVRYAPLSLRKFDQYNPTTEEK